jgi:hypothetical protein
MTIVSAGMMAAIELQQQKRQLKRGGGGGGAYHELHLQLKFNCYTVCASAASRLLRSECVPCCLIRMPCSCLSHVTQCYL